MNATATEDTVAMNVRMPRELAAFVDDLARKQFNSRGGILRLAVSHFKQATEVPGPPDSLNSASHSPELAGCH